MTPLARSIFESDPFNKTLRGAHFYDTTAIAPWVCDARNSLFCDRADSDSVLNGQRCPMPFDKIIAEEAMGGASPVLHVYEQSSGWISYGHLHSEGFVQLLRFRADDASTIEFSNHSRALFNQISGRESLGISYFGWCLLLHQIAVARLLLILNPSVFVHQQKSAAPWAKAMERKHGISRYALKAWTEIRLEVHADALREAGETQRTITGARAWHWVRGHFRVLKDLGKITFVKAHPRGDPALGFKQKRYRMTPAKDGNADAGGVAAARRSMAMARASE